MATLSELYLALATLYLVLATQSELYFARATQPGLAEDFGKGVTFVEAHVSATKS